MHMPAAFIPVAICQHPLILLLLCSSQIAQKLKCFSEAVNQGVHG